MNIVTKSILIFGLYMVTELAFGFEIVGEQINLNGKITSIELTNTGGVINVVSDNERYGKTWLTYNLKMSNPNSLDLGSFVGRATAINSDGSRASSTRQGVWSRERHVYSFVSLDDASDGNQYLCMTQINVMDDSVTMRFFQIP